MYAHARAGKYVDCHAGCAGSELYPCADASALTGEYHGAGSHQGGSANRVAASGYVSYTDSAGDATSSERDEYAHGATAA